ncbi:MAG: preprotein translocase subunit YajC [Bacteroidota bacterium]
MIWLHTLAFQNAADPGTGIMNTIMMFGLMFLILYFMIIRPQQKRTKERQKMIENLKKGDKVVTSGGIHGSIVGIDDKMLLVEIADKVKVKVERGSIAGVTKESEEPKQ